MSDGLIGRSCQLRSRSSFSPWNSPQSTSTLRRAGVEQVLRAGDRPRRAEKRESHRPLFSLSSALSVSCQLRFMSAFRQRAPPGRRCARRAPCRSSLELAAAHARDEAGHRLGGVGRIEKQRLGPRQRARSLRATAASACRSRRRRTVVDLDRRASASASACARSPDQSDPRGPTGSAGSSPSSAAAGSSALMPTTRVRTPASAQPATSPACVPPDDVEWTMTSGGAICSSSSATACDERGGAERRRGAERDDVGLAGPAARSSAATASIAGARASRVGT